MDISVAMVLGLGWDDQMIMYTLSFFSAWMCGVCTFDIITENSEAKRYARRAVGKVVLQL